jgi:hypothetical protein
MGYPGAYAPVISVGSVGWTGEWLYPGADPRYRMWWLQYPDAPMLPGSGDVSDATSVDDVYVSDFSSRELPGQQLDVLAPGSWVRGPFSGAPGFNHLPWWSKGIGDLVGNNGGNFYYVGGTSMASPHVASLAALMLQKNPALTQAEVESILKGSALPIPAAGSRDIFDFAGYGTVTWDSDCDGTPCNAVGAGLVQADAALTATPEAPARDRVTRTPGGGQSLTGRFFLHRVEWIASSVRNAVAALCQVASLCPVWLVLAAEHAYGRTLGKQRRAHPSRDGAAKPQLLDHAGSRGLGCRKGSIDPRRASGIERCFPRRGSVCTRPNDRAWHVTPARRMATLHVIRQEETCARSHY